MRRNAFGATNRPPLNRPGNGYGRPMRRSPGPIRAVEAAPALEPSAFCPPIPLPLLVWSVAQNLAPAVVWDGDAVTRAATPVRPIPRPVEPAVAPSPF